VFEITKTGRFAVFCKCLILFIGMVPAMNQNREPQNAASKTAKRGKPENTMRTITVVTQFRKAPRWMINVQTKYLGLSGFRHTGLDTRGTAQSPTALASR
jgi:hypothetical protein